MRSVLLLVVSIALADAINPGTLGPALYLATGERPRMRVISFGAAFLAVNLISGFAIVLGPGELLLAAVPHPDANARHWVELGLGVVLLAVAAVLILTHRRSELRLPEKMSVGDRGAAALGASIAVAELPTALPYFAAIAAIVGSGRGLGSQLLLVGIFNLVFMSPVMVVIAALTLGGARAKRSLRRAGDWLRERWPQAFAALALAAGTLLVGFGASGLLGLR